MAPRSAARSSTRSSARPRRASTQTGGGAEDTGRASASPPPHNHAGRNAPASTFRVRSARVLSTPERVCGAAASTSSALPPSNVLQRLAAPSDQLPPVGRKRGEVPRPLRPDTHQRPARVGESEIPPRRRPRAAAAVETETETETWAAAERRTRGDRGRCSDGAITRRLSSAAAFLALASTSGGRASRPRKRRRKIRPCENEWKQLRTGHRSPVLLIGQLVQGWGMLFGRKRGLSSIYRHTVDYR